MEKLFVSKIQSDYLCYNKALLFTSYRYPIAPFDFSVKGVTSISADVHKYGLGPKGTSVVLYRNHEIRKHQFVAVTEWTGGLYVSPTISGSRSGGMIAGAWAAMMSTGLEGWLNPHLSLCSKLPSLIHTPNVFSKYIGYLENTRVIMEVSKKIENGCAGIFCCFPSDFNSCMSAIFRISNQ